MGIIKCRGLNNRKQNDRSGRSYNSSNNRGNFPELDGYDPEIKLENVDKNGNILSVKEVIKQKQNKNIK